MEIKPEGTPKVEVPAAGAEKKVEQPVVPPVVPPVPPAPVAEKPKTVGEIQQEAQVIDPPPTVGLDKFLDLKKQNKDQTTRIAELEQLVAEGGSKKEVNASIDKIIEKYPDVNKDFLREFADAVRQSVKPDITKEADDRVTDRLKPLDAKEKQERIDTAFKTHFQKAIDLMPEFKDIVNPEVIKTLSLDPKNAGKTFKDLIEDTYGNALTGKRTIDKPNPGGSNEPGPLDFAKARRDPEYFDVVMANPTLKKEYNDRMLKEGF